MKYDIVRRLLVRWHHFKLCPSPLSRTIRRGKESNI